MSCVPLVRSGKEGRHLLLFFEFTIPLFCRTGCSPLSRLICADRPRVDPNRMQEQSRRDGSRRRACPSHLPPPPELIALLKRTHID